MHIQFCLPLLFLFTLAPVRLRTLVCKIMQLIYYYMKFLCARMHGIGCQYAKIGNYKRRKTAIYIHILYYTYTGRLISSFYFLYSCWESSKSFEDRAIIYHQIGALQICQWFNLRASLQSR